MLLQESRKVIGIELDQEMIHYLESRFASEKRLELIQADILNFNWERILRLIPFKPPTTTSTEPWVLIPAILVGNLPYNIATRILTSMTEMNFRFQTAVVMVQREVGRRLTALPGCKDYGYLSLLMQFHFLIEQGFDVPPGAFAPNPKVVSQVIRLVPRLLPLGNREYRQFLRIIGAAFRQRRKTLWNNLRPVVESERSLASHFEQCGIGRKTRPEQVNLQQYLCMTRMLSFPV